jgi:LacI family transcriptional regulator
MPVLRKNLAVGVFIDHDAGVAAHFHRGIARFARGHADWTMVLMRSSRVGPLSEPNMPRFDGLLMNTIRVEDLLAVRTWGIPVVRLYQSVGPPGVPMVSADNAAGAALAAEHLLSLGLRRFGYAAGPDAPDNIFRQQGFVRAIKAAGASVRVHDFSVMWNREISPQAVSAVGEWIRGIGCPCGVLAFSDTLGSPFIQAVRQVGFRVPDDVAVVGMDDDEVMCEYSNPPLSSVDLNYQVVGYEAAALLDRCMRGRKSVPPQTLIPPIGVIERGSSQMLAMDDDLAKVLRLMLHNLAKPLTVRQMAAHVQISERALELKFQRALGRSPSAELARLRVERAKRLLVDTDTSVSRIALQAGFASPAHFCRAFKQSTGATPGQHRRARRGGSTDRK